MIKFIKNVWAFIRRRRNYLLFDKYEIVEAFTWNGETFYMHKDPLNMLAGRGLTSMMHFEEMMMRCDVAYLRDYCAAVRKIFSDPHRIDILQLATITRHLEERVNFLAHVPDQIFKMASIVFFTKDESPFRYDQQLGAQRVEQWRNAPDMYDFFLQTPLKTLIPYFELPNENSKEYLEIQSKISDIHFSTLRQTLSSDHYSNAPRN